MQMGSGGPSDSYRAYDNHHCLEGTVMAMITIENLKYKYPGTDRLALDGISLSIEKGEFIGIIGQNGAGKSTLCQAMIGLVPQFYHGAYGGAVKVKERLILLI